MFTQNPSSKRATCLSHLTESVSPVILKCLQDHLWGQGAGTEKKSFAGETAKIGRGVGAGGFVCFGNGELEMFWGFERNSGPEDRGARDEDERGAGMVGRPEAERKGVLLRLGCSLSGAAHSDRIWSRPVQRLHLLWNHDD